MLTNFKIIYVLTVIVSLSPLQNNAQQVSSINYAKVKEFVQEGNFIRVEIDFYIDSLNLSARNQITFIPVIKNNDRELMLKPLIVNGRIRHKVYERQKTLGTLNEKNGEMLVVKKSDNSRFKIIPYNTLVDYREWMDNASLYLTQNNCLSCSGKKTTANHLLKNKADVKKIQERYKPDLLFAFAKPTDDKITSFKGNTYFKFRTGKSVIDNTFSNNATELAKLKASLNKILTDDKLIINKITINGYASIEGSYSTNKQLSAQRAKALYNYIKNNYNLPSSLFEINGFGEDWDGLTTLVENGSMEHKYIILAIIKSTNIFDGRERQLMEFEKGMPYRYMMTNYFPLLRRIDYEVYYTMRDFNFEEKELIFNEQPNQLTHNELYLLAEHFGKNTDKFNTIIETTARLYPNNEIANQNLAAVYAMQQLYDQAEELALKAGSSKDALNNLGAIYILQKKYNQARETLYRAKQLGSQDAIHNLNELENLEKVLKLNEH